jgi:LPXTG-motif cell wall-anchored protein
MEKKDNKTLFILLGIGLGIGVYYFLCKRKNKTQKINKIDEELIEQ